MRFCAEDKSELAEEREKAAQANSHASRAKAGRQLHEAQAGDRLRRTAEASKLYQQILWARRSDLIIQLLGAGAGALAWAGLSTRWRDRLQCRVELLGAPEIGVDPSSESEYADSEREIAVPAPWICPGCWESHDASVPPVCPKCRTRRPTGETTWREKQLQKRKERIDAYVSLLGVAAGMMLFYCVLHLIGSFLPRFCISSRSGDPVASGRHFAAMEGKCCSNQR